LSLAPSVATDQLILVTTLALIKKQCFPFAGVNQKHYHSLRHSLLQSLHHSPRQRQSLPQSPLQSLLQSLPPHSQSRRHLPQPPLALRIRSLVSPIPIVALECVKIFRDRHWVNAFPVEPRARMRTDLVQDEEVQEAEHQRTKSTTQETNISLRFIVLH
jgi:hypothetical protein